MEKNNLGKGWVLGETLITGIGQGYIQSTPLQLCMMTAQIANGGYRIKPKIIVDSNPISYEDAKQSMESGLLFDTNSEELLDKKLFKTKKILRLSKKQCSLQPMKDLELLINQELMILNINLQEKQEQPRSRELAKERGN